MRSILFSLLAAGLLLSCTTFQGATPLGRDAMDVVYAQEKQRPKRKIFLNFKYQWLPNPEDSKLVEENNERFKKQLVEIISESGIFELTNDVKASEEIWDIELNFHEKGISPWKIVSAVTLFIIPYWEVDSSMELKFNLKTTATSHEFYRGNITDNFVKVNQTLLVFAMPFNYKVPEKIRETLYRNFIKMYLVKYPGGWRSIGS